MPTRPGSRRGRWLGAALAAAAGGAVLAGTWRWSDRLEQDDAFCLGCHLEPGTRLHAAIGRDFESEPPASLASFHAQAGNGTRADGAFRCIDCHGGTSWPGRARVKLLAAKDAFWYATGRFQEPTSMVWPLWDEDCRKCHEGFDTTASEGWELRRFHEIDAHNDGLGVDCVECHRAHDRGVDPESSFLDPDRVRGQCARCHREFQER